jgi:hypothetical protein
VALHYNSADGEAACIGAFKLTNMRFVDKITANPEQGEYWKKEFGGGLE